MTNEKWKIENVEGQAGSRLFVICHFPFVISKIAERAWTLWQPPSGPLRSYFLARS